MKMPQPGDIVIAADHVGVFKGYHHTPSGTLVVEVHIPGKGRCYYFAYQVIPIKEAIEDYEVECVV